MLDISRVREAPPTQNSVTFSRSAHEEGGLTLYPSRPVCRSSSIFFSFEMSVFLCQYVERGRKEGRGGDIEVQALGGWRGG